MYINMSRTQQSGFSLLELAIAIMITGILFASGSQVYDNYRQKKHIHETQAKIDVLTEAFSRYYSFYGHYPCPAIRTDAPGAPTFGVATDCTTAAPAGTATSSRSVDHDNNPLTPNITLTMRTGSIPFVALRDGLSDPVMGYNFYSSSYPISARDTLDAYGNRFTYTLTESQGTYDYLEELGGVVIRDEFGNVLTNNGDYIIISHGKDGKGAYTLNGTLTNTPCTGTQIDVENCDDDFDFVDSLQYDSTTAYFDDQLIYRDWMAFFLWSVMDNSPEHAYNLNANGVGIGLTWPKQRLHVASGNARTDTNLMTREICDPAADENEGSPGTDCFSSDHIAGTAIPVCPYGQVAVGIANRLLSCVPLYSVVGATSCPPGQFITGFQYDPATGTLTLICAP